MFIYCAFIYLNLYGSPIIQVWHMRSIIRNVSDRNYGYIE